MSTESREYTKLGKSADDLLNELLEGKHFRYIGPYNPNLPQVEIYTLMLIPQKGTLLVSGLLKHAFSSDVPVKDLNKFREIL